MNIRYWLKHNTILAGLLLIGVATVLFVKIATTPTREYPIEWAAVGCTLYIVGFLLSYWAAQHD